MQNKEMTIWESAMLDAVNQLKREVDDFHRHVYNATIENANYNLSLDQWKHDVLDMLPAGCSLKFANDVRDMLDKFKEVY